MIRRSAQHNAAEQAVADVSRLFDGLPGLRRVVQVAQTAAEAILASSRPTQGANRFIEEALAALPLPPAGHSHRNEVAV
jgi:hypothetical protein